MKTVELDLPSLQKLFAVGHVSVDGIELCVSVSRQQRTEMLIALALNHPDTCTCDDTLHSRGFGCL